jgi:hypothetical protein
MRAGREDEVRDRHLAWYAQLSYAQATAPGNWSALQFGRSGVDNQRHAAQWATSVNDPTNASLMQSSTSVLANRHVGCGWHERAYRIVRTRHSDTATRTARSSIEEGLTYGGTCETVSDIRIVC